MKKWFFVVVALLMASNVAYYKSMLEYKKQYEVATANIKNYDLELSASKEKNTVYQLTIDQLESFQDSILRDLNSTREELKIKDKNLKALQSISSTFTRIDTLTLRDTLFISPSVAMDTVMSDNWYSVQIGLRYPSSITVKPEFKSKKNVIVYIKKETVKPAKKFFIARWLQRKHKVINVDVVEKNPYVEGESSKYVEIIK